MLVDPGPENYTLTVGFTVGGNGVFAQNWLGTSWHVLRVHNTISV